MSMIRESDLPGIGKKFQIDTRSDDKLVVVIHDDGRREMHHFDYDDTSESISTLTLEDDEARQLAGIIGGMTYRPTALENVEVTLEDLVIEWCRVESGHKAAGKSIAELQVRQRSGVNILAIIGENGQKINPGPDDVLETGAMIVLAGERNQIKQMKELLVNG
ncbi:cation:proton antiporter regulatory subunit [Paenibacillus lemnae]|uniref:Cation:proton antiporter regulatory subunit n=1 Tax=Paenibacillus lemnae TaxID=1330551 RepID=A0A848M4G0_PAELE|nr:cation:proton antiporter regulatory subunit [Paenibacillus lemnae]NMO95121.1 cation:proton antiporter regulatory subunit [Paenibacillus lemnae]